LVTAYKFITVTLFDGRWVEHPVVPKVLFSGTWPNLD